VSDVLREAILIAARLTMGLMAGVFGLYSQTIMPALRRTDDGNFVAAFQSIDRAIINPAFMATFFGAPAAANRAATRGRAGSSRTPRAPGATRSAGSRVVTPSPQPTSSTRSTGLLCSDVERGRAV
jgi:hypothetical protein